MLGSKQNKNEIYAKSSNLIACTSLKLKLNRYEKIIFAFNVNVNVGF